MSEGKLTMSGELETKLYPGGKDAPENFPLKTYPDFYHPPKGENPIPTLGFFARWRIRFHSWNQDRLIRKGKIARGRIE